MSVAITPSGQTEYSVYVNIKTESLVMVGAVGLAGEEVVTVSVSDGLGAFEAIVLDGTPLGLEAGNNVQHLRGPGVYVLTKPATAGDSHLFMYVPVRGLVETREVE